MKEESLKIYNEGKEAIKKKHAFKVVTEFGIKVFEPGSSIYSTRFLRNMLIVLERLGEDAVAIRD